MGDLRKNILHDDFECRGGRGGGYFLDSWWSMLPDFPNPHPISEQEMSFFTPVFRPGV